MDIESRSPKIIIVGGSNSLRKNGWVSCFEEAYTGPHSIDNMSIGGASTIMGVYRSFFSNNIRKNDVVVWEYALNDANFFEIGKCRIEILLRHVEHLIRRCAQKGALFVPVIMSTLRQESRRGLDQYRAQLHYLFSHYKIDFLDVSFHMRHKLGAPALGREYYDDGNHYALGGEVVSEIGKILPEYIKNSLPIDINKFRPLFVPRGVQVRLIDNFDNGDSNIFENSVFRAKTHTPGDQPIVARNDSFGAGFLTGLVVVTTSKGGVIDLGINGEKYAISLVSDERSFRKPVLKFITLSAALGKEILLEKNSEISIGWSNSKPPFSADLGCSINPKDVEIALREASIVGLMCELSNI